MVLLRKSEERGHANHGWLESFHTFSFAGYYDPQFMAFGPLRVINEDFIAGGGGFPTHPHEDMEIITYVIEGALQHKDSMGNSTVIKPGEVQKMSAGTGVRHSEFNPNKDEACHLLQIWVIPSKEGIAPSYDQKNFAESFSKNKLTLVASPTGEQSSIQVTQDMRLHVGNLKADEKLEFTSNPDRKFWIQLVKGEIDVNGNKLQAGDALAAVKEDVLNIKAQTKSEFLVFDLP